MITATTILGANIGTTVTGWLVALIGFKINITAIEFSDLATRHIEEISGRVSEFLTLIGNNITRTSTNIITSADVIENRINELRKEMRKDNIKRLKEGICDVDSGLIFIDMLTSFEKIGDHAYNIAEGISGLRIF